ncbi:hypothetical protein NC652_003088 [Populus alba x Populus x berolinensis]|nr:hypothetical protein NC652_003088 [Populus alba x Populus x berolinensis]
MRLSITRGEKRFSHSMIILSSTRSMFLMGDYHSTNDYTQQE